MIFILARTAQSFALCAGRRFNKRNIKSAEAALKYFPVRRQWQAGGSRCLGLSLLYGMSGSTNLPQIACGLCRGRGLIRS